jgi:hypothetical protein
MGKNVTQKLIESYLVRNQKGDSATARPFDKSDFVDPPQADSTSGRSSGRTASLYRSW